MQQANSLMMFQQVANNAVTVEQHQDGDTMIAMVQASGAAILIISLKTVSKGYYSLAYHYIGETTETSQDFSLPFPANVAPIIMGEIINDVF